MRFLRLALLSVTVLFDYASSLQCAACSNRCPIKGQYLYNLDNIGVMQEKVERNVNPFLKAFRMRTTQKIFSTSPNHGHWSVTIKPNADDTSVGISIQSGEKFTTNYIVTMYYTSPDVGIASMDYYLNFPDICDFQSSAMSVDDIIYVEIFQRADVAISQQLCKPAQVATNQMKQAAIFVDNNFRHNDLLYSQDREFTARHDFQHPLVKLSVAMDQTEWNSYVFVIPHSDSQPILQYWLRSGESCYYFLLDKDVEKQEIISVFV